MKVLLICSKFPYPLTDGGAIAMFQMAKSYAQLGHEVVVLAMNTPKHSISNLSDLPNHVKEIAEFYAADINTEINYIQAAANLLFSHQAYHIQRFTSAGFRNVLLDVLKKHKFDIIQFETLFVVPYLETAKQFYKGKEEQPKFVYRAHNVEHEIWERRAKYEQNAWKQYYFNETHRRLRQYEKNAFRMGKFDLILPVSEADAKKFKPFIGEFKEEIMSKVKKDGYKVHKLLSKHGISDDIIKRLGKLGPERRLVDRIKDLLKVTPPIKVAMIGLDMEKYKEVEAVQIKEGQAPRLFYIGALDWDPNQAGLDWFLAKVWPVIEKKYPEVTLSIAGRRTPKKYFSLESKSIKVLGEVPDAKAFIMDRDIMIVPLQSGSGMRVKIIEGLAMGRAVLATKIAAEGLPLKHGEHIMIAEKDKEFQDQLSILIESPGYVEAIAKNGKALVEKKFNSLNLTQELIDTYQKL